MKTIKFKNGVVTNFTGRNGFFKQTGIEINNISQWKDQVILQPITSKGEVGNCSISIPFADIPELILELQKAMAVPKGTPVPTTRIEQGYLVDFKITGEGEALDIAEELELVAADLRSGDFKEFRNAADETEWEMECLFTSFTESGSDTVESIGMNEN